MLIDRRRQVRTKVTRPAKIIGPAAAAYDCIVDDLNTLGASVIATATRGELPTNFDLTFDNCHTFWSCRVIWRNKNGERVGVNA
jgi:hypothetical protein